MDEDIEWIACAEAIKHLQKAGFVVPGDKPTVLAAWAAAGLVQAFARTVLFDGQPPAEWFGEDSEGDVDDDEAGRLIPRWAWEEVVKNPQRSFVNWRTASLQVVARKNRKDVRVEASGLEYRKDQLERRAPLSGARTVELPPEQPEAGPSDFSQKRGRPAGKNGKPIARLTLKYFQQPLELLGTITHASAGVELLAIYKSLGLPPPNATNAERDAGGILEEVRAARGLS